MKRRQTSLTVARTVLWVQLILLVTFSTTLFAQEVIWAKKAGGTGSDQGYGIAVDGSGNSYVTGSAMATFGDGVNAVTLSSPGSTYMFVAKYTGDGNLAWAKKAGGTSEFAQGLAIAVGTAGNSYVTGSFAGSVTFGFGDAAPVTMLTSASGTNDIFIAKYNSDGSLVWAKRAGGTSADQAIGIAVDGSGNSYVTGVFSGTATFGGGEANQTVLISAGISDVFVAKYNNDGSLAWAKKAGGTSQNLGNSIAGDSTGNSYVTGFFLGSTTFGAGEANQTVFTSASGSSDIFIAKYNSDGSLAWAKKAGGTGSDQGNSIAADGSGNSYAAGLFSGTATFGFGEANQTVLTSASGSSDIFIAKYNNDGSLAWANRSGGTASDVGISIAVGGTGSSYVTGIFESTATFGGGEASQTILTTAGSDDIFVAKYSSNGSLAWAKKAGGTGTDVGYSIAVDSTSNSYVTGRFNGTPTFGAGEANQASFTSAGNFDIFVAKFSAKLSQTITFGALTGKTFGDSSFDVSAKASSNLAVSFGAAGNCSVAGTLVTITGAGSCTITASQAGDATYAAATDVPQSFTIAKVTPLITWSNPADISPGTPLSSTQLNATVTLNGSNVSGTFVYTPGIGTVLPAGSNQQLALNFTPADTANYNTPAQKVVSINVAGLTVVPNSAVRGGSVTARWSGIPSPTPTDWIGLYQVGAPNSPFWEWEYVSCSRAATVAKQAGSCSFPIPSPPNGTYELRLFSNNGFTRIFTSNPFTIGVAAPTLPVVTIAATNNAAEPSTSGSFTVSRSIVSADPLTVNYTVTGSAAANSDYTTLSGAVTIPSNAQTAPITVSPIDDNVFEGNESVIVTLTGNPAYTLGSPSNATLQIIDNESPPAGPTVTVTQGSVVRGGSVTVTWNGIVSPSATDWFGLYQVGAPNSPFWEWEYVSCTKSATTAKVSGSCTFPIPVNPPAGNYNLRLFSNNNFTLLTTSNPFVLQ